VSTVRDLYRSHVHEYRLLFNSDVSKALTELTLVAENIERINDRLWFGLSCLNLGLCCLLLGKPDEALTYAQTALNTLEKEGSWQVSDAYHLLSRCNLAIGNIEEAKHAIAKAKTGFMLLQLFHRVTQVEMTETDIEIAQEENVWDKWRDFTIEELEQKFRHVGI
jgi:tetratricopeptide (TPR) repeat protein